MSGTATDTETDEGGAPPSEADSELEDRAKRMGWVPRDRFRGRPEKWTPADVYIERGERMLPLLQERNRAQDERIVRMEREQAEATKMLGTLVERTRKAEQVGYNRAMRELGEKRDKAIEEGDLKTVRAVEQEMADIPKPEPEPPKPDPNAPTPADTERAAIVTAWRRDNRWFDSDPEAHNAAVAALSIVERDNPGLSLEEHLSLVRDRVKRRFPEHFEAELRRRAAAEDDDAAEEEPPADTRRGRPPRVSPSGSAPSRAPGPRSFEAMPQQAKREYERQAAMLKGKGDPFTKEEYARYYWEAEGE